MSDAPRINRVTVFPIKSLDGVRVDAARLVENGGLDADRRYAVFDADGAYVNGRRTAAVHRLRASVEVSGVPAFWEDRLCAPGDRAVAFDAGDVRMLGANVCRRCVVATRGPDPARRTGSDAPSSNVARRRSPGGPTRGRSTPSTARW